MTEKKYGTGSEGDVTEGVEDLKQMVLVDDDYNHEPFGDKCDEFVEDVYNTLDGHDDRCLVRGKVKKFVGCVSSGFRSFDGCDSVPVDTDEGEVDACGWKGSMNLAWDIAKNIRCE